MNHQARSSAKQNLSNMDKTPPFFCELSTLEVIEITGPDRKNFLQGQLTCDINDLSESHSLIGAHCNPKGRIESLFRLVEQDDKIICILPQSIVFSTFSGLKKYAVFSKVSLLDLSEQWVIMGLCTDEKMIPNLAQTLPQEINGVIHHEQISIIRMPGNSPRYEILLPREKANHWKTTTELRQVNTEVWQALDIEQLLPSLDPKTVGKFLPHDLNLPELGAVSFKKGCYTGQEIIARMEHRGTPKRHMIKVTIESETAPEPGTTLMNKNNEPIGTVVFAAKIDSNQYRALIVTSKNTTQ